MVIIGFGCGMKNRLIPPHLPDNALLLFKQFKEAYDTKNITRLGFTLSDH
jgi:hypothetical protein